MSSRSNLMEAAREVEAESGALGATAPLPERARPDVGSLSATSALQESALEISREADGYADDGFEDAPADSPPPRRVTTSPLRSPRSTAGALEAAAAAANASVDADDVERDVAAELLAAAASETAAPVDEVDVGETSAILAEAAREVGSPGGAAGDTSAILAEAAREVGSPGGGGDAGALLAEAARETEGGGDAGALLAEAARETGAADGGDDDDDELEFFRRRRDGRRVRIARPAVDLVRERTSRKMLSVMPPEQARLFQAHFRLAQPGEADPRERRRQQRERQRQQRQQRPKPKTAWAERLSEPKTAPPPMGRNADAPETREWLRKSVKCTCKTDKQKAQCSLTAPHPRCARARRAHASIADARECTFRPKTKKRPGAEEKGESSDNFINRMDAAEKSRRAMLESRRGEADYKLRQDKKVCPTCGVEQSYNEVVSKQKRCSMCGVEYRPRKAWSSVSRQFWRRLEDHEAQRKQRRSDLEEAVTPRFSVGERKSYSDAEWSGFLERMEADRRRREEKMVALQSAPASDDYTFTPKLTQSTHNRYVFKPFMERMADDVMRRVAKSQDLEWASQRQVQFGGAERKDDYERLVLSAKAGYEF